MIVCDGYLLIDYSCYAEVPLTRFLRVVSRDATPEVRIRTRLRAGTRGLGQEQGWELFNLYLTTLGLHLVLRPVTFSVFDQDSHNKHIVLIVAPTG